MLWLRNLRVWENHRFGIVPYMYALVGHRSDPLAPCHAIPLREVRPEFLYKEQVFSREGRTFTQT
jgi:hypothetical protein